ncbi:MAG: primosomal protein DnaI [Enterococcus sp.]
MEDVGKNMQAMLNRRNYQTRYQEMMAEVLQDADVKIFLAKHQAQLSTADIEKSYAKLYEFVQEKKKFQENDPHQIAQGYEPQLTLNHHYVDVTYIPTQALLERKQYEEIKNRIRTIEMPKDIKNATMQSVFNSVEREEALFETMKFIKDYTNAPHEFHKALYLAGDFGVGKTYLLGAMANELAKRGIHSTLVHFPTFSSQIKSAIANNTVNEKLEAVKKAQVLILDDVGAEAITSWTRDEIFGVILQYRMQEQLPTFFTSNLEMRMFEEHLRVTKNADEPLKAKRLMERVRYLAKEIIMSGENLRNKE